ncbi:MAG: hypothetical protein LQ339_006450 [Xanthoria mediterranea]|nr:MAG: hypothetical protein LQ339_006450 [Xanthoria mediterranea]
MLNPFIPFLTLAVSAIRLATALPVLEPASTIPIIANPTVNLGAIDPRFNGHVAIQGRQILDLDAGLIALTKMLHHLSNSDFHSAIGPTAYIASGYTSVSIEVRGVTGPRRDIPVRYAIWGASRVGEYILHWQEVRNHVFALTWERAVVGYIEFKRTANPLLGVVGSGSKGQIGDVDSILDAQFPRTDATSQNLDEDNRTISLPLANDNREMTLQYHVITDHPMTKWELFANIYAILALIGQFPPRQRTTDGWMATSVIFPLTHFFFTPIAGSGGVEFRYIADAAMSTAFFILRRGLFFSVLVRVLLDGEPIGQGLIGKGDLPPPTLAAGS